MKGTPLHRFRGGTALLGEGLFTLAERGSQVHFMAEFQELLDFPPAPKLGIDGKLDPAKATEAEMRGQELFFGSIDTLPHLRVQRRADVSLWAGGSPPSPERSR